jgi:hypothetical protein
MKETLNMIDYSSPNVIVMLSRFLRGYVMGKQTDRNWAMAAVGLSEQDVALYIQSGGGVVVACENSPSSITISGPSDQLDRIPLLEADSILQSMAHLNTATGPIIQVDSHELPSRLLPCISRYPSPDGGIVTLLDDGRPSPSAPLPHLPVHHPQKQTLARPLDT